MTDATYLALFASSFLAATVLPAFSEITLLALLGNGGHPLVLWGVASLGNTLGSVVNYWLGGQVVRLRDKPWFPVSARELERGQRWFQRYGVWSLLLAWLPIGGDALTVVAGVARVRFSLFLCLVALGKAARYAVVIGLALSAGWASNGTS